MKRRSVAPLIRVRQEVWKRVERVLPAPEWTGAGDTIGVLDMRALDLPPSTALPALAARLREGARSRYPLTHLVGRDPSTLPDRAEVIADAERLAAGDWDVLGRHVRVTAGATNWRAHPLSSVSTPARHFSQVSYAADVLGGDVKYLWEVNRHAELLRLGQAYWLTRRPEFAESAIALLDSWLEQNRPGVGINWISCVDVAFRAIAWCWLWQLTADSAAWSDTRVARLVWWVAHAARFIARYDSVHHSPNTHLTGEALGLVYIATVFPALRGAERWLAMGTGILQEEAPRQFLADGMHYERCTGYHRYHLEFYLHAVAIARATNATWARPFVEHLSRAADVSVHLRRPDGSWPVFGDEDGGWAVRLGTRDVTDQCELLAMAARLVDRRELAGRTGANDSSVAWWTLDDGAWRNAAPLSSSASVRTSASFGAAGYHSARDSWDDAAWHCVVDAGPHGGDATGHAHTDLGHVEVTRGRQWITVDPGCPVYTGEPERRNWFRGQRAHATVLLDDTELATPGAAAFRWETVAPTPTSDVGDRGDYWYCRLAYDYPTPRGAVAHERQVVLLRGYGVLVCDILVGDGPHGIMVRWPLAVPRGEVSLEADLRSAAIDGTTIRWTVATGQTATCLIDATRRSPKFGVEENASALVLSLATDALPCTIVTTFASSSSGMPVTRLADDVAGADAMVDASGGLPRRRIVFRRGRAPQLIDAAIE